MAISSMKSGLIKRSLLVGYPPVMATPTATDGGTGTTVSVAFTAVPGATSYTVLSTPGSITASGSSSPITVSGLTAGTAYTLQVRATNSVGTGAYSAASNSVTPVVPTSFESIASLSGNGSATSFTFSSIPSTYKHLQLRGVLRDNAGGNASSQIGLQFNASGSFANGTSHWLIAIGDPSPYVNVGSDAPGGEMKISYASVGSAVSANNYGMFIMDIYDYASTTKNKTMRTFVGADANGNANATQNVGMWSNLWLSTSAINEVKIVNRNGNAFTSLSNVALYGIKGA